MCTTMYYVPGLWLRLVIAFPRERRSSALRPVAKRASSNQGTPDIIGRLQPSLATMVLALSSAAIAPIRLNGRGGGGRGDL